jgi:hypothetical protein
VNKNPELQAAKMAAHFDGKDCFPHNDQAKNTSPMLSPLSQEFRGTIMQLGLSSGHLAVQIHNATDCAFDLPCKSPGITMMVEK